MNRAIIIVYGSILLLTIGCGERESEQVSVWSVASVPDHDKSSLFAVDGRPASYPWAVGENGTLIGYDGYLWEDYYKTLTDRTIYDIDISSSSNGWAVGADGILLRFVNESWYAVARVCNKDLYGVSINVDSTGWAVGDGGCILKFDGTGWKVYNHDLTAVPLRDVVVTKVGTAWAVGDAGTILFYDGAEWESVTSPTTNTLYGVAATSADGSTPPDIFICGDGGAFFELTGSTWSRINLGTTANLRSVSIYNNKNAFVVGQENSVFGLAGNNWEAVGVDFFPFEEPINLKHVVLISASEGWAVGSNGVILRYGPATDWHGDHMKNKWREDGDKEKLRKKKSDESGG
jgi:photosystem II stability/assembly factor-like uncharacterized protein